MNHCTTGDNAIDNAIDMLLEAGVANPNTDYDAVISEVLDLAADDPQAALDAANNALPSKGVV